MLPCAMSCLRNAKKKKADWKHTVRIIEWKGRDLAIWSFDSLLLARVTDLV
jgi:hypothetical protein